ncbi:MAG: beta-L-arabinofuranosidase domain-containing protein [Saprospiraceae bacterium]
MKSTFIILIIIFSSFSKKPIPHQDYPIVPVEFQNVKLTDGFWKKRVKSAIDVTIPYAFEKCEETGRIDNFKKAGGLIPGKFQGHYGFDDSDVYKIMEGAAYSLMTKPDQKMSDYLDSLIYYIGSAQEADGYLYTAWSLKANDYNKFYCCTYDPRGRFYAEASSHELYDAGHMYEAAVAHYNATGKKDFLDIATKNADLIYDLAVNHNFGFYPGHQEIEIGLVKLFRATGNENYLHLAKLLLDRRGHAPVVDGKSTGMGSYSQDHIPVTEQMEAVGHSVRAGYMYSAMADIAAITGDPAYLKAVDHIWENIVTKKLYLTGGLGAVHGIEGFDKEYVLPNDAYAETCAAIANVYFNHRMFLLHGDAKYIDVLERSLYNSVLPGLSLEGNTFFYPNPLVFDGKSKFNQGANCRSSWFNCSCCPSNLSRIIPSIAGYIYAQKNRSLYVNLFMNNETTLKIGDDDIELVQRTDYPWSGKIKLSFNQINPVAAEIKIRIPGWSRNEIVPGDLYDVVNKTNALSSVQVNGETVTTSLKDGYVSIDRSWKKGDVIEVNIPMENILVRSNPKVSADSGKIAVQRGPLVYCAEGVDNDGKALSLTVKNIEKFSSTYEDSLLHGVTVLESIPKKKKDPKLTLVPYYAWGHRGLSEMNVWLNEVK